MMQLLILIIAFFSLFIALSAHRGAVFEKRYEVFEELSTIFSQFLEFKFSTQQLHKIERLISRSKFLFNYDKDILAVLNKAKEYTIFFLNHKNEEKVHGEKVTKKEQEMERWIDQISAKKLGADEEQTELEKAFARYLKVSIPIEVPAPVKEFGCHVVEYVSSVGSRFKK